MLFQTPTLSDEERTVIEQIDEMKQRLRYVVSQTPKRWTGLMRRNALARAIRASNTIEGYNVTVDDAIAAAAGEQPLEADTESWAAVTGYRSALTYVLQLADDPHFVYSPDLLRSLHFMMMQHDLGKFPGKWRPGAVYVRDEESREVVYEGPDDSLVPSLVQELVESLNDNGASPHGMVRAAMAHLNLVLIHPFKDGNGRMARCLQTLVLARMGIVAPQFSSIEEYLGRNTRAYYAVLAEVGQGGWHPERGGRPWIRFCLTAHFTQATTLLRRSREIERLWEVAEIETQRIGVPERAVLAVVDAALGSRVRNATYRAAAEISDQLASRDLKALVDGGLLVAKGQRRGRHYIASDRMRDIRQRMAEPKAVPDPFSPDSHRPLRSP